MEMIMRVSRLVHDKNKPRCSEIVVFNLSDVEYVESVGDCIDIHMKSGKVLESVTICEKKWFVILRELYGDDNAYDLEKK